MTYHEQNFLGGEPSRKLPLSAEPGTRVSRIDWHKRSFATWRSAIRYECKFTLLNQIFGILYSLKYRFPLKGCNECWSCGGSQPSKEPLSTLEKPSEPKTIVKKEREETQKAPQKKDKGNSKKEKSEKPKQGNISTSLLWRSIAYSISCVSRGEKRSKKRNFTWSFSEEGGRFWKMVLWGEIMLFGVHIWPGN